MKIQQHIIRLFNHNKTMNLSFTNKVVLINGATSGIGKTTAIAFAKAGAKVVLSGRRENLGAEVVSEIHGLGGEALFVKTDVSQESEVAVLVEKTVAHFGRLDVAFNNAGVEGFSPVTEVTEAEYHRIFDVNVWGAIASMKYEIPAMLKSGGGSIINTSSAVGHVGMANTTVYVASKHAVEGITKAAALEYAQQGIRVNAVAPGAVITEMFNRFAGSEKSDAAKYLSSQHPIGRLARDMEIAQPVLWLASEASSFVTGQSIRVDGGFTVQ